jgi:hydroxymethylpyrimidine pyrophosphatase-like HAD family hydrolase
MFKQIAIYDMDGTIVDSSHRYRTITGADGTVRIDLAHWRDNEYKAMEDGLLPLADQYMRDNADPDIYVIIATARILNEPDRRFIREILGSPDYIVSRGVADIRSGKELKIKGLQKFFNLIPFQGIDAVFYEDNIQYLKAVCDHFNIRGVYIPSVQGH